MEDENPIVPPDNNIETTSLTLYESEVAANLDTILTGFFVLRLNLSSVEQMTVGKDFNVICEDLNLSLTSTESNFLRETLLSDGYIEPIDPRIPFVLRISSSGVRFVSQGGYVKELENRRKQEEAERVEMRLKQTSISSNLWNRVGVILGLLISIASLAISIIALNKD